MKAIGKLGDKILSAFIPQSRAAAVCPPDCVQERQMSDGKCRYRSCCYHGANCTWRCSSWGSWGSC